MRRGTRLFVAPALAIAVWAMSAAAAAPPAAAHPLGNFTVNLYGGLTVRPDGISIDYVVDMAEIPAFQERRAIDTNHDGEVDAQESAAYGHDACARIADGLSVQRGSDELPVQPEGTGTVSFPPGAGGLSTLRLECRLAAPVHVSEGERISYRDANESGRIGWHEVTAVGDGVTLAAADVPTTSTSARLTSYPTDLLSSPLDQRTATITVGPPGTTSTVVDGAATTPPIARGFGDRFTTAFADLVTQGGSSPVLWIVALAIAFAIGAAHALGPGHGKTLMAAYLAGNEVKTRQVVAVGAAVSLMHTASVIVLGVAVLVAGRAFSPEVAYRWTTLASGLVVALLGAYLLVSRLRGSRRSLGHAHPHGHDHPHPHQHPTSRSGRLGLATLAVSGGILPSPSALIALLAAIAIGRIAFGLALVLAFGIGLAAVLTAVGFGTIKARRVLSTRFSGSVARWAPIASAAGVCMIGIALVVRTA